MPLRRALAVLLEELVEPLHGLQESSLLGELDLGVLEVAADSETVLDAGVQDHLVRDGTHVLEDLLRLVTLLFGEDGVGFCEVVSDGVLPMLVFFVLNLPAAAIESGPVMPLSSASSTKDG
jgi:hypothetical protein